MINFLLLFIAVILSIVSLPLAIVFQLIAAINSGSTSRGLAYLSGVALTTALTLDLLGNSIASSLLDNTMRTSGGYPFGTYKETISKVLGKNKAMGTLSKTGKLLADTLNAIQKNHVEVAANS